MSGLESWHSYPKVYALGHRAIAELLLGEVQVEEKVDGSQFSFGRFFVDGHEELRCRSKGAQLNMDAPDNMFKPAVEMVKRISTTLHEGWTYRGEFLGKPKHNVLAYDKTPENYVIIFDINTGPEGYMSYNDKYAEAHRIGLQCVPCFFTGVLETPEKLRELLEETSILGGQKVEGVVIKNYARFCIDGHAMMGKFVSEAFKEVHAGDWKERNPTQNDILTQLQEKYRTPARWSKAVQHLREQGKLDDSPKDIGNLIKEAQRDVVEECSDEMKEHLWKWAKPHIVRMVAAGLPEWYKEELLKRQFEPMAKGE